jgi:hypothetical protein
VRHRFEHAPVQEEDGIEGQKISAIACGAFGTYNRENRGRAKKGRGTMKGLNFKIFLKILLHALLIWIYTYLLVDFAMKNNYPNYVFGIFVLGLGLGYFIAKIKFEKA